MFKFRYILVLFIVGLGLIFAFEYKGNAVAMKSNEKSIKEYNMPKLTSEEAHIILAKGTEAPYSGEYHDEKREGAYICRQCGELLYTSDAKFDSRTGWPSFDDEFGNNVKRVTDADGRRVELVCAQCGGHLGHVFEGEGFTQKSTRHCVNSLSIAFVPNENIKTAVFAGGCFWGVEQNFSYLDGVMDVSSGYSGGTLENPRYEDVTTGKTGHAESVQVTYDASKIDYETLAKVFFEVHDPTQYMRQGPDVGSHYRSVLFYNNEEEKNTAEKLIKILEAKGLDIVTELVPFEKFYVAEDYHQDYIRKTGRACSLRVSRFE